ncbi:ABC transporter permease [Alkalibacillus silvisoli]|uniref:ABC3 transporter permease C-terminal domain-containing protein n=1 Tax=Alkalibacillus silvisoli TaxID=392823 RepID=A0ABN0ZJL7_9BACI
MMRFIWQNWWRKKERLILLLIGAFIISAGLTYLIGLSDSNRGTIVDSLQNQWSASYDIVVRPEGSRSVTEEKELLEPNYLSGLNGGISVDQYEAIKEISGIEVAAPIAVIGYADYETDFGSVELEEEGIYRKTQTVSVNDGIGIEEEISRYYFPYNVWDILDKGSEYGVGAPNFDLSVHNLSLLAGIDPEQEAKLIGLDEAILDRGSSRFFKDTDGYYFNENKGYHEFPIIVNNHAFVDKTVDITYERLDLPINDQNADELMEEVKNSGGQDYLHTVDGSEHHRSTYTGEEAFHAFISEMTGVDWETGKVIEHEEQSEDEPDEAQTQAQQEGVTGIVFQSSQLNYEEIGSPYANRWPYSYQLEPVQNSEDVMGAYANQESFREPGLVAETYTELPRIKPDWIGFYDSSQLTISQDPTSELPMETYRPASAELVMDGDGQPVNPPQQLKPNGDPYSFLTDPPGMLTTIEAAEELIGHDEPISAIRVKVTGVTDMGEESQEILEQVASEIENQTGLITDITLGSSPQLALTYVPEVNDQEALGWLQQPWVNIGSSISIFRETKMSFTSILASVMIVAVVYVWSSGIVSLLSRRKEFAVLLSIGWRPSQISKLLLFESIIVGLFVALTSWMMLGFVYMNSASSISIDRFVMTGLFGFLIYLLGAVVPIWMTKRIRPYEAIQSGEISKTSKRMFRTRGLLTMAWSHFVGKWKRSLLSIISIALPTALLGLFLYITFQLRGVMYTSLLGEYVALEVGPTHYVAIVISLIIAILTTAEIIWQNVSERSEEISLLQAIGWRSSRIRGLILAEGMYSGLCASIVSMVGVVLTIYGIYGEFPIGELGFIILTGLIPVVVGLIGTIIPAERAVRILPNQGIQGSVSNRKVIEKRMKWGLGATAIALLGTFLFAMVQVAPNIETTSNDQTDHESEYSPTVGEVSEREEEDESDEVTETQSETVSSQYEDYHLVLEEGQNSREVGYGVLSYSVERTHEETIEGTDMKKVTIDFEFEILDNNMVKLRPKRDFYLMNSEERYRPTEVNITEVTGWEEEEWLKGIRDGKMVGTLTFEVPANTDENGLLFLNYSDYGRGIFVEFN